MDKTEDKPIFLSAEVVDCLQGYTNENIAMEFAKDDIALRGCNGCSHFTYDGEICNCDYLNK